MNNIPVYLYLQKIMLKHSVNNKLGWNKALYIISRFGIPKHLRHKALDLMIEAELIKKISQKEIKIIHQEKSENVKKHVLGDIWEGIIK